MDPRFVDKAKGHPWSAGVRCIEGPGRAVKLKSQILRPQAIGRR